MSSDDTDTGSPATNRRTLLKGVGGAVAATALGAGAASADVDEQGEWEYRCLDNIPCGDPGGIGRYQRERRYCSGGQCSGWEPDGCC